MMKFKKHGFVLLPAVLSIFILGLLGVSLASIYSDTFATLSAGKAASSAQQFAQIEAEYLKTLGFDEAATGKHTWNTMEKFVGDADGKEWESQVENVRHMQVSEDNAVDIYKISVRKKGDKTSAYSVEIPLSSQGSNDSMPVGAILPYYGDLSKIPARWRLCDGTESTPDLRDRFLVSTGTEYSLGVVGGAKEIKINQINLPSDGLNGFGYVLNGIHTTWKGNYGVCSGNFYDQSSLHGSDGWQSSQYYISFNTLVSNYWKGTPINIRPPYFAVYYIMKIK